MSNFKRISSESFNYEGYVINVEINEIKGIEYLTYGISLNGVTKLFISQDIFKASVYKIESMIKRAKSDIDKMLNKNKKLKWYEK